MLKSWGFNNNSTHTIEPESGNIHDRAQTFDCVNITQHHNVFELIQLCSCRKHSRAGHVVIYMISAKLFSNISVFTLTSYSHILGYIITLLSIYL